MPDTTIEEARRCPICEEPGASVGVQPGPERSKIHLYACTNKRCRWGPDEGEDYGLPWPVQVLEDGTIPVREGMEKQFPHLTPEQRAMAQRHLEQEMIADAVERANITGKSVDIDEQAIADRIRRIANG